MKNREDRRIRKTRKILKDTLVEKLQQQRLSDISVKSLCEAADINRSTFYLHYNNVHALWNSVENEIIESMNSILESFEADIIISKPLPLLLEVTEFLERETLFNKKLFNTVEASSLLEKIKKSFIDYFLKNCSGMIKTNHMAELNLYITFVISGSVSLFYSWFLEKIDISMNQLAHIIENIITKGVDDYLALISS